MRWDVSCIKPAYRPLMESQTIIEISGGVAEAILLGDRAAWQSHCSAADLERAADLCRELR